MSMPKFPDGPEIKVQTAVSQILSSIAHEELGLAHIINAEGEKIQYVLGTLENQTPLNPSIDDVLKMNKVVKDTLSVIAHNQFLLNQKMDRAMDMLEIPQDGLETPSDNADLTNLRVEGYTITPVFKPNTLQYTLTVPYNVEAVNIIAVVSDSKATISGDGIRTLTQGDNVCPVTITAENGKTKTYTVTITREVPTNSNTEIGSILITDKNGKELIIGTVSENHYSVSIPYSMDGVIINVTPDDPAGATVSGKTGPQTVPVGSTDLDFYITAADGTTEGYTVTVNRASIGKETGGTITVKNMLGELLALQDDGNGTYTLSVPYSTNKVVIEAEATDPNALVSGDIGETGELSYEEVNEFTVTIAAEDRTVTKDYNILITRGKPSLNISVDGVYVLYDGSERFDLVQDLGDPNKYTLTVAYEIDLVELIVDTNAPVEMITGGGDYTLNVGENDCSVKVETGDPAVDFDYEIIITRLPNTRLKSLDVGGTALTPAFNSDIMVYEVEVPRTDKVAVSAETVDPIAEISDAITGVHTASEDVTLSTEDDATEVTLTVTGYDDDKSVSDTRDYAVTITKGHSLDLKTLIVGTYTLSPELNGTDTEYTLTEQMPYTETPAAIIAEAEDPAATVTMSLRGMPYNNGIVPLTVGGNDIKILVTVEEKSKEYTLTIDMQPKMRFDYTGHPEEFIAPETGTYKVELWGASGGVTSCSGKGAYVKGEIELSANDRLSVYVGGSADGYNGGGIGVSDGGGATDIRFGDKGLVNRIMVAAGGGSHDLWSGTTQGGYGGGLNGGNGTLNNIGGVELTPASGARQTQGGSAGNGTEAPGFPGEFGRGTGDVSLYGSGGGGGYYGGGSGCANTGTAASASGGSSFISGHAGCDAVASGSTDTSVTHTGQANHFSGKVFTETLMIDGEGYEWTPDRAGTAKGMPTIVGDGSVEIGHTGDGYAKFTLL